MTSTSTAPSGAAPSDLPVDWDALQPPGWYARKGHRWLDWLLLVLLLPLAMPLMVLIAVGNALVFRDPRRVFFSQPRVGWRGQPFTMLKFRTMDEAPCAMGSWSNGIDHLRVTRFGRFLRNTHLDELPQLFNILKGDMSFIGPRPEMMEVEQWAVEHIPGFGERLATRPGVTGLAQITQGYTGRDLDAYAEKLLINRVYMRDMSLALDLSIVLRTFVWMVRGKGWSWSQGRTGGAPAGGMDSRRPKAG